MPTTQKHFKNKTHKSKTHKSKTLPCPIGLKPFEEEFSKNFFKTKNKISGATKKKNL